MIDAEEAAKRIAEFDDEDEAAERRKAAGFPAHDPDYHPGSPGLCSLRMAASPSFAPPPRPTRADYDAARRGRRPRPPRFRPIPRRRGRIYRSPEALLDEARRAGQLRFPDLHRLLFVHYRIVKDSTLNPRTRAVSEVELGKKLRCSDRTVRRLVAWGIERGWLITIGKSFDRRRGRKGANQYVVVFSKTPDPA
jgi:hypothetical protein